MSFKIISNLCDKSGRFLQVSPEDIWQSYSEMHMKSNYHCRYDKVLYLKSSPASDAIQKYLKLGGLSASVPSVSMDTETWLLDAPWTHPLRVLSQECLTVVSTFAGKKFERSYPSSRSHFNFNFYRFCLREK